jgi:uncharacterized protein (DUF58 family)
MRQKILLLGLIIYILILAGIATRQGGFLSLAIPLMIYLAISLLYEPEPPRLKVTRILSNDRVNPNQPVTISLTITNEGERLEEIYLEDTIPVALRVIDGSSTLLTTFQPGQSMTLTYAVAGQRGLYRFSAVRTTVRDPVGLFEKEAIFEAPAQLFVLPEIVKVRQIAIRPRRIGVYSGLIPARQGGSGIEFFGVREYQLGDPLRWVNARASARYDQKLFINEFEQERMADIGLILDARQQSDVRLGQQSLFEYSIQAAATLTETFLGSGNRVGLFIYGRSLDWTFPGYGKVQLERILRALARAEQGDGRIFENFEYLPTRLFPPRSQLVLISPLLRPDPEMLIKLRARGYQLLVISPDPISFEEQKFGIGHAARLATQIARLERNLILRQLSHAGIQVINWPVETPFHQIAHGALSRLPLHQVR